MNLNQIIRIVLVNIKLMLAVGFLVAVVVFLVKRNDPDIYSSNSSIYTGLATGYDIESGSELRFDVAATNSKFDNLIDIIKRRSTHKETALRLLAQHLSLETPTPRIISAKYYYENMAEIPQEVKDLAVKTIPAGRQSNINVQQKEEPEEIPVKTVTRTINTTKRELQKKRVQKFREENIYHTVKSGEAPNAIAGRYSTTVAQLKVWNNDLKPYYGGQKIIVQKARTPYFVEVEEWVDVPVEQIVEEPVEGSYKTPARVFDSASKSFDKTYEKVLSEQGPKQAALEQTYINLKAYAEKDENNYISKLLESDNPFYSIKKISTVNVFRQSNSDVIVIRYNSYDQGVCQQTLKILTSVFTGEHRSDKSRETGSVVEYFRHKLASQADTLAKYENELLEFNRDNNIINYPEQTKYIAEQKEIYQKDYFDALGNLSKAKTSVNALENEMDDKELLFLQSETVMKMRADLADLSAQLAIDEAERSFDSPKLAELKLAQELVRNSLKNEVSKLHDYNRSTEGLPRSTVLQLWLAETLKVEQSKVVANTIMAKRRKYFVDIYKTMSSLGPVINRLERTINVNEQEYLNLLHNLNQAILKQQNIQQSNMRVTDPPFFPVEANGSKTKILIIIGFMVGFMITGAIVFFLEFIDTTIKTPERAAELTGMKLFSAFPKLSPDKRTRIDYSYITNRLIEIMVQKIKMEVLAINKEAGEPVLINLVSTRPGEGKSFVGKKIANKLQMGESRVIYLKPYETTEEELIEADFNEEQEYSSEFVFEYDIPPNFLNVTDVSELIQNFTFPPETFDYIILELPALLRNEFPVGLVNSADMTILVCLADRIWNKADQEVVNLFLDSCRIKPKVLVNSTNIEAIESIIGEIPKYKNPQGGEPLISINFKSRSKSTGIF